MHAQRIQEYIHNCKRAERRTVPGIAYQAPLTDSRYLFQELLTCGTGTLVRLYTRNYSTRKQIHTQARGRNRRPHPILTLLLLPRCTYPIARSLDLFAYPLPGLSIRLCGQAQPRFILVKIPIHMCSFLMSFRHSEDLRIKLCACWHVWEEELSEEDMSYSK